MSTPAPKPLADQIQDILARYRNLKNENTVQAQEERDALAKMIRDSGIPLYHKEAMMVVLFAPTVPEMVISLEIVRQQEHARHASSMLAIEQRLLQERLQKTSG